LLYDGYYEKENKIAIADEDMEKEDSCVLAMEM
jgi:hypothetical protein